MFTELIDTLRCPNAHEDSWLVATSTRNEGRHIVEGRLGCPICRATFVIAGGEARFGDASVAPTLDVFDDDAAFRLAAQLLLLEAPAPVMLVGRWTAALTPLLRLVPTVKFFVGDARLPVPLDDRVSALRLPPSRFPLAATSLRALAVDDAHATPELLLDAARVLRTAARLVVPAGTALDPTIWKPLASDADVHVAERLPVASAPIQIKRAPSQPLFEV